MSQPYLSLEAQLHDAFWEAEDDGSEVRLMADFLKQHPGTSLEVGSGSGRLMFPLIQQGFSLEGLELSPDMIALGKTRAENIALTPIVHHGDMSSWHPGRRYAALLAPAFTLQLAPAPAATLHHWRDLLVDAGGLYLTTFTPYAELLGDLPENEWYPDHQASLPDGRKGLLETRHRIDRARRLLHREHRYSVTGNPPAYHQSSQTIRWFDLPEMTKLLNNAGFSLFRLFADFNPHPLTSPPDPRDFDGILTYQALRTDPIS